MSKYCPLLGRKVVYLECQECEEKVCKQAGTEYKGSVETAQPETDIQKEAE